MKIYIDNIVLNFQKIGEISVYITNIIKRLLDEDKDVVLVEQDNVGGNILRKELNVSEEHLLKEPCLNVRLSSYLPIKLKLEQNSIVHSI